ncbi:hypothetical protein LIA77_04873 [Sarocladium implicatum]|nr:hypothetical protein LIA77_04873 [Sarocladium implicatum]
MRSCRAALNKGVKVGSGTPSECTAACSTPLGPRSNREQKGTPCGAPPKRSSVDLTDLRLLGSFSTVSWLQCFMAGCLLVRSISRSRLHPHIILSQLPIERVMGIAVIHRQATLQHTTQSRGEMSGIAGEYGQLFHSNHQGSVYWTASPMRLCNLGEAQHQSIVRQ